MGATVMKLQSVGLLSFGHLATDITQGAVPALLPFFIATYGLTYTEAAGIVFAANITGSVIQPMFGYLADRWSNGWLMPSGIVLAGLGMGLCGWFDSYQAILLLVVLSGVGVSAFHPTAAKLTNKLAGPNKAMGMSIFSIGGNGGFAFGPLVATTSILLWGLKGTIVFTLLGICTAVIMYVVFRDVSTVQEQNRSGTAGGKPAQEDQWFPFCRLSGVVIARSIMFYGLNTFIPLYWIQVLQESPVLGSTALTILFGTGMISTLIGGRLSDRFGYRNVIIGGWILLLPSMYLFTLIQSTAWATALLIPISLGLFAIYSPMMVMGQNYLPNHVGFASGVTIGLAITIGGLTAPFLGRIADMSGITAALDSLLFIPLVAIALALTLPKSEQRRPPAKAAA